MSSRVEVLQQGPERVLSPDPGKHDRKFWILTWVPAAIAIAIIATESTSMMGADHTSVWLRPIWTRLFGALPDDAWYTLHWKIRKCGHILGYGGVSVAFFYSWYRSLRATISSTRKGFFQRASALAMVSTVLVASADEFHQLFLPNRGGSVHDVALDTIGATLAQLSLAAIYFLFWRQRSSI